MSTAPHYSLPDDDVCVEGDAAWQVDGRAADPQSLAISDGDHVSCTSHANGRCMATRHIYLSICLPDDCLQYFLLYRDPLIFFVVGSFLNTLTGLTGAT